MMDAPTPLPPPHPGLAPLPPTGPGSLSRQLVARTTVLVAVLALLLAVVSTVTVRQQLIDEVDAKIDQALVRTERFGGMGQRGPGNRGNQTGQGTHAPPGTEVGQVIVVHSASESRGLVWIEGGSEELAIGIVQQLLDHETRHHCSLELDGLGPYRVRSTTDGDTTRIVALPLAGVKESVNNLVLVEVIVTLLALAAAAMIAQLLVTRSLRPLNRLAATATEVANLPLDRGEVVLPMRVAAADADPSTEVGRVGHALNHMLNHVEGALAARQASESTVRQFVSDASHELRNPLAAIRGYAELTRRGRDQLPDDTRFAMGRIEAESERMSRLVEDMLLLARLDEDRANLQLTSTDVVEVVLNATSDAQVGWPAKKWSLDLPEGPVVVLADRQKLHQVVANLLSNANKHTPDGTHVRAGVAVVDGWTEVTVTDDGPGIDPSVVDHVFERFARADSARAHTAESSTGLGLAIVAALVEAQSGTVSVSSVPGRTTFTVRLPLA